MRIYIVIEQYPYREIVYMFSLRDAILFKNNSRLTMPLVVSQEVNR